MLIFPPSLSRSFHLVSSLPHAHFMPPLTAYNFRHMQCHNASPSCDDKAAQGAAACQSFRQKGTPSRIFYAGDAAPEGGESPAQPLQCASIDVVIAQPSAKLLSATSGLEAESSVPPSHAASMQPHAVVATPAVLLVTAVVAPAVLLATAVVAPTVLLATAAVAPAVLLATAAVAPAVLLAKSAVAPVVLLATAAVAPAVLIAKAALATAAVAPVVLLATAVVAPVVLLATAAVAASSTTTGLWTRSRPAVRRSFSMPRLAASSSRAPASPVAPPVVAVKMAGVVRSGGGVGDDGALCAAVSGGSFRSRESAPPVTQVSRTSSRTYRLLSPSSSLQLLVDACEAASHSSKPQLELPLISAEMGTAPRTKLHKTYGWRQPIDADSAPYPGGHSAVRPGLDGRRMTDLQRLCEVVRLGKEARALRAVASSGNLSTLVGGVTRGEVASTMARARTGGSCGSLSTLADGGIRGEVASTMTRARTAARGPASVVAATPCDSGRAYCEDNYAGSGMGSTTARFMKCIVNT